jgi:hypothetical protein
VYVSPVSFGRYCIARYFWDCPDLGDVARL